jgi:hypothetical protein
MALLARAQSLSGRPHDALVMIDRLAAGGFMTTAATSPDFERVRSLPEWADVSPHVMMAWVRVDRLPRLRTPGDGLRTPGYGLRATGSRLRTATPEAPSAPVAPTSAADAATAGKPDAPDARPGAFVPPPLSIEEMVHLPPMSVTPAGLARDGVSGRYVIADRAHRKLVIVDERAHHMVDLVGAASAGFNDIAALVIDVRRGDLWVVSTSDAEEPREPASVLHRVQLISGRPLAAWPLPAAFGPSRFGDVDVGDSGTVFVLDLVGRRVFPVTPRTGRFRKPLRVPLDGLTSLAVAGDRDVYVAHDAGISRISLAGGAIVPVRSPKGASIRGFERIRWDRGRLVGIQRMDDGSHQPVSLRLNASGNRVITADVIETPAPIEDPTTIAVSDGSFYFVTRETPGGVIVIQKVELR